MASLGLTPVFNPSHLWRCPFLFRNRKVGGIRFIRIHRLQLAFCVCSTMETRL